MPYSVVSKWSLNAKQSRFWICVGLRLQYPDLVSQVIALVTKFLFTFAETDMSKYTACN